MSVWHNGGAKNYINIVGSWLFTDIFIFCTQPCTKNSHHCVRVLFLFPHPVSFQRVSQSRTRIVPLPLSPKTEKPSPPLTRVRARVSPSLLQSHNESLSQRCPNLDSGCPIVEYFQGVVCRTYGPISSILPCFRFQFESFTSWPVLNITPLFVVLSLFLTWWPGRPCTRLGRGRQGFHF